MIDVQKPSNHLFRMCDCWKVAEQICSKAHLQKQRARCLALFILVRPNLRPLLQTSDHLPTYSQQPNNFAPSPTCLIFLPAVQSSLYSLPLMHIEKQLENRLQWSALLLSTNQIYTMEPLCWRRFWFYKNLMVSREGQRLKGEEKDSLSPKNNQSWRHKSVSKTLQILLIKPKWWLWFLLLVQMCSEYSPSSIRDVSAFIVGPRGY